MDSSSSDFGFGFNNAKFSDKILSLCLISDPDSFRDPKCLLPSLMSDPVDADSVRKPKRPRQTDSNGNDAAHSDDNQASADGSATESETKTLHISSLILAAKSPFFLKLFSNGMTESTQQLVTLRIQHSEEAAVMELLKFMYTNTLSSATSSDLLEVLKAADKYEVVSCMKCCVQLLLKLPMTFELALSYLDLPSSLSMVDSVKSLTAAAKEFLVARFNDGSRIMFEEKIFNLPLVGIEAILSSDDLEIESEDEIYGFVMKWALRNYTNLDERREILSTRLHCLIRFPFMSCKALEKVLTRDDIDLKVSSKLVFQALSFKITHRYVSPVPLERVYTHRPVKVIRFESPREEYHIYLDLKHEECARLQPFDEIFSQTFELAGQEFYLSGEHCVDQSRHSFAFYLVKEEEGLLDIKLEFS